MRHDTLSCLVKITTAFTVLILISCLCFEACHLLHKYADSLPEPTTQTTMSEHSTSSNTRTWFIPIPIPYQYNW